MDREAVERQAKQYSNWAYDWLENLPTLTVEQIIEESGGAEHVAVASADMINGFCKYGNLAQERIDQKLSQPIADLFEKFDAAGVDHFISVQEGHPPDAKEFSAFPPHGLYGSGEDDLVPEIVGLPFSEYFHIWRKNSLTPVFGWEDAPLSDGAANFSEYLDVYTKRSGRMRTVVVVGNCTDLCVRELAQSVKFWANQNQVDLRVIVPERYVETYDMEFETAENLGAIPHPGDLMHLYELTKMALNDIEVVKTIE